MVIGLSRYHFHLFGFLLFPQATHIQITRRTPLGAGDMPQASRHQHQGTVAVREAAHHPRATADLFHDPLQHIR